MLDRFAYVAFDVNARNRRFKLTLLGATMLMVAQSTFGVVREHSEALAIAQHDAKAIDFIAHLRFARAAPRSDVDSVTEFLRTEMMQHRAGAIVGWARGAGVGGGQKGQRWSDRASSTSCTTSTSSPSLLSPFAGVCSHVIDFGEPLGHQLNNAIDDALIYPDGQVIVCSKWPGLDKQWLFANDTLTSDVCLEGLEFRPVPLLNLLITMPHHAHRLSMIRISRTGEILQGFSADADMRSCIGHQFPGLEAFSARRDAALAAYAVVPANASAAERIEMSPRGRWYALPSERIERRLPAYLVGEPLQIGFNSEPRTLGADVRGYADLAYNLHMLSDARTTVPVVFLPWLSMTLAHRALIAYTDMYRPLRDVFRLRRRHFRVPRDRPHMRRRCVFMQTNCVDHLAWVRATVFLYIREHMQATDVARADNASADDVDDQTSCTSLGSCLRGAGDGRYKASRALHTGLDAAFDYATAELANYDVVLQFENHHMTGLWSEKSLTAWSSGAHPLLWIGAGEADAFGIDARSATICDAPPPPLDDEQVRALRGHMGNALCNGPDRLLGTPCGDDWRDRLQRAALPALVADDAWTQCLARVAETLRAYDRNATQARKLHESYPFLRPRAQQRNPFDLYDASRRARQALRETAERALGADRRLPAPWRTRLADY